MTEHTNPNAPGVTKPKARSVVALVTLFSGVVCITSLAYIVPGFFGNTPEDVTLAVVPSLERATTTTSSTEATTPLPPPALPVRLRVPALDIDAAVQYVGTTSSGAMGIPSNFTDVAWYRPGVIPGQWGSAVIAGHLDNGLGLAAVFKQLELIARGEEIVILTEAGTTLTFIVEGVEQYPYEELPLGKIFNRADAARLVLITCAGNWLRSERTYDERLVVYARLQQ